MSDYIDRQAAIDAFNTNVDELVVAGKENADSVEKYLNGVIDKIKRLPSVQPDIARDIATILENEKDMRVILNAPSVQLQKNDETCDSCRYRYNEWDEDPCDGCTPADSGYCPDNIELQPPISLIEATEWRGEETCTKNAK